MIDKYVKIKINPNNFKRLKKLKYKFNKVGETIQIKVSDLSKGSHVKINVECVHCKKIKKIDYCNYINQTKSSEYYCNNCIFIKSNKTIEEKYGVDNISKLETIKKKKEETTLKNYNVKYTFQSKENILKRKKTLKEKYGVEHNSQIDFVKKSKQLISDDELNLWEIYRRNARNKTKALKEKILKKWNGYDFYDKEYIKDNFNLNCNDNRYPNIDHKISIFYGFKNDINVDEIASINNLCITKRLHNIKKNIKTDKEYKKIKNK